MSTGDSTTPQLPHAKRDQANGRGHVALVEKHEAELYGTPGTPGLRQEVALLRQSLDIRLGSIEAKLATALEDRAVKRKWRKDSLLLAAAGCGILMGIFGLFLARMVFKVI